MSEQNPEATGELDFTHLTRDLIAAYVSNNPVPAADLPSLIVSVHGALTGLGGASAPAVEQVEKATSAQIRKSITPDALISFIDGKPYKTLRRHLTTRGNLSPEEYRAKYGLPHDYPMVAENYAKQRSQLARDLGLGKVGNRAHTVASEPEPAPEAQAPRGRATRKKAGAATAAAA